MSKPVSEQLFRLVKSLSKSEKRQFKLLSKRTSPEETKKFVSLFDAVDSMNSYDEVQLRRKVPQIPESQIPNMKAHLYDQILRSLRMASNKKNQSQQILLYLEHAGMLYNKCLYSDALHILDKAKIKAVQSDNSAILPAILELEKNAMRQGMSQNIEARSEQLIKETRASVKTIQTINAFSNLALKLNSYYQKQGFIRSRADLIKTKKYFEKNLPAYDETKLSFAETGHLYSALTGYYLFIHDFNNAYEISARWLDLFEASPSKKNYQLEVYIKALNTALVCQNKLNLYDEFVLTHRKLVAIKRDKTVSLTKNVNLNLFKTIYIHEINRHFMLGEFKSGTRIVSKFQNELNEIIHLLDKHTELIFYYKIACLYFGGNNFKVAIKWLNLIIREPDTGLREDLHAFSRLLRLICYFEMGDAEMIEMNTRTTYRFLLRKKEFGKYESYILKFLRDVQNVYSSKEVIAKFNTLKTQMLRLERDKYERRAFNYFDIISYLESKIEGKTIEEVFKEKIKRQVLV